MIVARVVDLISITALSANASRAVSGRRGRELIQGAPEQTPTHTLVTHHDFVLMEVRHDSLEDRGAGKNNIGARGLRGRAGAYGRPAGGIRASRS